MSERIEVTHDNLTDHFIGIMISVEDIGGKYSVPGWQCVHCGWGIGTAGLPPSHQCPDDGDAQKQRQQAEG